MPRVKVGSGCGGGLGTMGKVLEYNGRDRYPVWPTQRNSTSSSSSVTLSSAPATATAVDYGYFGTGFPSMRQMAAGSAEIAAFASTPGGSQAAQASGRWEVPLLVGYNGILSPPQLI